MPLHLPRISQRPQTIRARTRRARRQQSHHDELTLDDSRQRTEIQPEAIETIAQSDIERAAPREDGEDIVMNQLECPTGEAGRGADEELNTEGDNSIASDEAKGEALCDGQADHAVLANHEAKGMALCDGQSDHAVFHPGD